MHYVYCFVCIFLNKQIWYLLKQHSTAGTLSTTQQRNTASTTSIQLISQFSMNNVDSAYPGCGPATEIVIPHRFATLLRTISPSIVPNFPVQSRSRKRSGSDAGGQGKLSHISMGSPIEFFGSHCRQCCLSS